MEFGCRSPFCPKRVRFDLGVISTKSRASGSWLWNLPTTQAKTKLMNAKF
jgi:hypothetical protein